MTLSEAEKDGWKLSDSVSQSWEMLNQAERELEAFTELEQDLYTEEDLSRFRVHLQHAQFTLQGLFQDIGEPLPPKSG